MIPLLDPTPKYQPLPASLQLQVVPSADLPKHCNSPDLTLLLSVWVSGFVCFCLGVFLRGGVFTVDTPVFVMQITLHS